MQFDRRPRVRRGSQFCGVLYAGLAITAKRSVLSAGAGLCTAREQAHRVLNSIRLPGSHFRMDIRCWRRRQD